MPAEIIDINDLVANDYEPLRQHRWILGIDRKDLDAFTARSWSRPHIGMGEIVIDYINDKRYLAGKAEPQTMTLVLNDPISPSASQKVMEWINATYETLSGRAGYAAIYKKRIYLKMLDPAGVVAQTWELIGTWINDVDFGTLDYATADPVQITLTLRFDKAVIIQ